MIENISHRGVTFDGSKENTMEAFLKSLEYGYDGIELDLHLASDNKFVVIHDPTVESKNQTILISEITSVELKSYNIPSFLDVLQQFNTSQKLYIELKKTSLNAEVLIKIFLKELSSFQGLDPSHFVISFQREYLEKIAALKPEMNLGLTFLPDDKEKVLSLLEDPFLKSLAMLLLHESHLDTNLAVKIKDAGLKIGIWGIKNEVKRIEELIKMPINVLMTDCPHQVQKILKKG